MTILIENLRADDQTTMLDLDTKILDLETKRIGLEGELTVAKGDVEDAQDYYQGFHDEAVTEVYLGENAKDYKNEAVRKVKIAEILNSNEMALQQLATIREKKQQIIALEGQIKLVKKQAQSLQRQYDLGIALLRARR